MARIITFPRAARRRFIPQPPAPVRYVVHPRSWVHSGSFTLLMFVTIPAAFLYFSGMVNVARHDALYGALLVAVWSLYFASGKLLRTRLGPLLARVGRLSLIAGVAGFFGFVYWIVLTHP